MTIYGFIMQYGMRRANMTWNERKLVERMYVRERKSIMYIASVLHLDLFEIAEATLDLTRDPTPHSRSTNERRRSHAQE